VNLFLHHLLYIYILLFFFFIYNHPFLLFVFYRPVMLESYVANNFQFCPFILISHNIKKEQTKNSFILIFNKDKKKKGKKGGETKRNLFHSYFQQKQKEKMGCNPLLYFVVLSVFTRTLSSIFYVVFCYCVGDPVCLFFFFLVIFVGIFFVG
jgi:hypothetical protein